MKFLLTQQRFFRRHRGAALLIALCFLVLLSAVVLALFSTSRADRQNANVFATGQETLRLADAAVNLVQGQIRDATIQPRVGWASQPGMIRTFTQSGTVTAYKLYSSDQMIVPGYGKAQIDAETTAMETWNTGATGKSFNALYADLNSPAVVKRPDPANPAQSIDTPLFPIADPAAIGAVEGFSATNSVAGTVLASDVTRRLPMPVKWLYVLRDGQMTAPTGGDATKATFTGATVVPTADNPIVGRVAFWADDDTCKLNINTASEGIYWDSPKTSSWADLRMAASIPVQGEFQRLSGHPATTSLSPVFSSILPRPDIPFIATDVAGDGNSGSSTFTSLVGNSNASGIDYYKKFASYYNLTPRINWSTSPGIDYQNLSLLSATTDKSSRGGVQRVSLTGRPETGSEKMDVRIWPYADQDELRQGSPVIPDGDRLYATAEEIFFKPDRADSFTGLSSRDVAMREFFLTAQSRSPETTLLGTPRISLWPVNSSPTQRNSRDKLLDFCAQIGGLPYSFQRKLGTGSILDGAQPADLTASNAGSDVKITRNEQLITYLQNLCTADVPGFGSSLASKWSASGADKVIVQAFDYVRSNINADYVKFGNTAYRYSTASRPQTDILLSGTNAAGDFNAGPRGTVVPAEIGSAKGAGRFITFSQFTILFMASEIENTYSTPVPVFTGTDTWTGVETIRGLNDGWRTPAGGPAVTYDPPLPNGETMLKAGTSVAPTSQRTTKVRAVLLMQPFNPHPGRPIMTPSCSIEIDGLNALQIAGVPFSSQSPVVTNVGSFGDNWQEWGSTFVMNEVGNLWQFTPTTGPYRGRKWRKFAKAPGEVNFARETLVGGYDPDFHYGFISPEIVLPPAATSFSFVGGGLTVKIYPWSSRNNRTSSNLVQTLNVNFDSAVLPVPRAIDDRGRLVRYPDPSDTSDPDPSKSKYPDSETLNFRNAASAFTNNAGNPEYEGSTRQMRSDWHWLSFWKRMRSNPEGSTPADRLILPGDVLISKEFSPDNTNTRGDYRVLALTKNVPASYFKTVVNPNGGGNFNHSLRLGAGSLSIYGKGQDQYSWTWDSAKSEWRNRSEGETNAGATLIPGLTYYDQHSAPYLPAGMTGALLNSSDLGDWQSGFGNVKDGGFFGREDTGDSSMTLGGFFESKSGSLNQAAGDTWEPNRFVPSAGIFGRFLTTDSSGELVPWQTLLFTARPAAGLNHPGFGSGVSGGSGQPPRPPYSTVPDHLFLDNFWMPVVEPYALSEPVSTAGKVNLNFQMMPFTHVTRSTALQGAMKSLLIGAVEDQSTNRNFPVNGNQSYKNGKWVDGINLQTRHPLALDETMGEVKRRFDAGDVYRSATEVATVTLVPKASSGAVVNPDTFWSVRRATSDSMREQPYTALLSRVTTKSNTFTVHYRVQALRQPARPGRNWAEWEEGRDQVVGEYRGSTTIERFLDPNAQNIPDYTEVDLSGNYDPIDRWYRWRVISQKQFAP